MKLTLAKTWQLCLRMWKWIAKETEEGSTLSIWDLKSQWLEEHGFSFKDLGSGTDCFFCEYNSQQEGVDCKYCPGYLVSKSFHCYRMSYHHRNRPIQFYKKLVELNNKRLEQNKTKKRRKK